MVSWNESELISAFLDEELTQDERRRVETLLESSPEARTFLQKLKRLKSATTGLRGSDAPREIEDQFRRLLDALREKDRAASLGAGREGDDGYAGPDK